MNFEGPRPSYKQKIISRDNHGQNIWDKLSFSCENTAMRENFNFYFSTVFCKFQKKFFGFGGKLETTL